MNKKKLSVVMAGAMLASSVAPVLAAEVQKSEVSANELGLLQEELRTLVDSKVYSNVKENNPGNSLADLRKKSVYAIYINGKEQTQLVAGAAQSVWQGVFNNLDSGDKIEVYSDGFKEVDGKVYGYEVKTETPKYTKVDELKDLASSFYKANGTDIAAKYEALVSSAKFDERTEKVTVTFTKDTGMEGDTNNSIVIGLNDNKLDVNKFINADGDEENFRPWVNAQTPFNPVTPGEFYGFAEVPAVTGATDIKSELLREITITPGGYDLTVEELYDGLMLTEKGHDFFNQIKDAKAFGRHITIKGNNVDLTHAITEGNVAEAIKMVNGKARFSITFGAKDKLKAETYTITGTNEANTERLAKCMVKPLARVDILAGDNRYETAVKIAEEYAGLTGDVTSTDFNGNKANIVLVNGNALVDGLAAAPLAAKLSNNNVVKAPILLTEADSLPKATKAYLKEVLKNVEIGGLENVTIHLVGGESVLNKSLERELKGLGFSVERYGGDNREETSLEVAEAIKGNTIDEAFVVGAEGEADAMSIAAVAAEEGTPIIVAKKGGITEEATYELRNSEVTVIGGENAVSKEDYNAIKAEATGVLRIAGSNRQATNAEIVKKYYKNNFLRAENIIVAKDGKANKTELVDALAAANMAAAKNAPIVLATDKLSKDQLNALILNAKKAEALYQVGIGVNKENVVKVIATQLGLTNR